MKPFERMMRRLGWVRYWRESEVILHLQYENDRLYAKCDELENKVRGIAAMTPEQRSARTAKGNRTRALMRANSK